MESQREELSKLGGIPKTTKEERKGLPPLPRAEEFKLIVTRFAPNPNGPLHIGHVRAAVLSHEYARRYDGRFILRFEDTNPENAMLEMYDMIKQDLRWLGLSWDEEFVQSDRLNLYYDFAEKLIANQKAYVCTCPVETFRQLRDSGIPCPCRDLSASENAQRWSGMLAGDYGAGSAVLRIKTDLNHPNPAVRDWPAFRIVESPHPRAGSKYRVWPLYNFAVSIDDHEMGITHIFRGKEHEVNEQRQRFLFGHFKWEYPVAIQYGRLNIPGTELSKTAIVRAVQSGELSGYDDVRLATLAALRRRGFLPQTLVKAILDVGVTPVDSSLSWETLYAYNRRFADQTALRFFFVPDPIELRVQKVPPLSDVRLRNHPSRPEAGERIVPIDRRGTEARFFVPSSDASEWKEGDIVRLKDLMNISITRKGKVIEAEFFGFGLLDVPKIQWVSRGAIKMNILMPDATVLSGLAEPSVASVHVPQIVQFERFGFVRIEKLGADALAVFAHT
jgi:glutamyl-tRNA synthetase